MPMLKTWMEHFASVLHSPIGSNEPDDWTMKMEVSVLLTSTFSSLVTWFLGSLTLHISGSQVLDAAHSKFP